MTVQRAVSIEQPRAATVAARPGRALLLRARELRGQLSLAAAAARIGIRSDELSKIERGETKQVRWETLLGMAEAYDVEIGELLVTAPTAPETPPAYAGILEVLRAGAIERTAPPRFVGDPDIALAERATLADHPNTALADFSEPAQGEVRRSAFRPTRR